MNVELQDNATGSSWPIAAIGDWPVSTQCGQLSEGNKNPAEAGLLVPRSI
jgi:hypothetical protein